MLLHSFIYCDTIYNEIELLRIQAYVDNNKKSP